ncbi:IS110 family transposase [Aurantiacibacter zhengii]|uniref:IS110 family transposase n=1 Tax=Aurantiacibacter zhengii TaxID=2307003 RepID=A0A418NMK0_9SPHN|nr:IS110 family transposase [Aurantiacibacter zhengii]RIV82290.1 IS110 family transposase [Aurantiacibacter zhengii]RIV82703.1 IS110 family transposase [Aurantiacibacter zhengii]RIV85969.1 IS110 family transposase [Aurantiacibacter zhengii]
MSEVVTIGLDIAKSVFQVHGVGADGKVLIRRRLTRARMLPFFATLPRCLVGIEACNNSHYWARELTALGHDVKLMPAQYVKPYVKRGKNDAADAEAICEAVTRPTMRFVAVKSPEQQSLMMLHRVRLMLNRQRTQISNAIRAHISEFGVVAPVGRLGVERLLEVVADAGDDRVPEDARLCLQMLAAQLDVVKQQILENDRRVLASARRTELGRRLMEIPGVGPLLASAFVASVADPTVFKTGRDLAAWIGLVPKQNSSGGKERLGSITRAGNRYLRQMLVVGAMAVIRHAERHGTKRPWLVQLLARRPAKVAAVALANKNARMVWALMTSGERYRQPQPQPMPV